MVEDTRVIVETLLYRLALRGNVPEKLTPDQLDALIRHRLPTLRRLAAAFPRLHKNQQLRLARDPSPTVRKTLAANPGLHSDAKLLIERPDDMRR